MVRLQMCIQVVLRVTPRFVPLTRPGSRRTRPLLLENFSLILNRVVKFSFNWGLSERGQKAPGFRSRMTRLRVPVRRVKRRWSVSEPRLSRCDCGMIQSGGRLNVLLNRVRPMLILSRVSQFRLDKRNSRVQFLIPFIWVVGIGTRRWVILPGMIFIPGRRGQSWV